MLTFSLLSSLIIKSYCWLNCYFSSEAEGWCVLTAVRFLSLCPQWWCFRRCFDTRIYIQHWMAKIVCLANGRSCFTTIHKGPIWLMHVARNKWQHFSVDILFLVQLCFNFSSWLKLDYAKLTFPFKIKGTNKKRVLFFLLKRP